MTDIFSLKVEEIVSKIKDAQLTSLEVCQKYIERINKFEKDVKAWAHFDKKLLLEKAEEADQINIMRTLEIVKDVIRSALDLIGIEPLDQM